MNWKLTHLQKQFDKCLRDTVVFSRDTEAGNIVEFETYRKGQRDWLVVAAGIWRSESDRYFSRSSGRRDRAVIPLQLSGGARASMLYVVRPWDAPPPPSVCGPPFVTTFDENVEFLEVEVAYVRLWDLARPGCHTLRWELDGDSLQDSPLEPWLRPWRAVLRCNPAHPSSHLHVNTPALDEDPAARDSQERLTTDLRLAVGIPNPLALLLSLAAWLRAA